MPYPNEDNDFLERIDAKTDPELWNTWHDRLIDAIRKRALDYPDDDQSSLGLRRVRLQNQAGRMSICGLKVVLFKCQGCEAHYYGLQRCESRICESCAAKYAGRIRNQQREIIKNLQPRKGKRLMFLTVTKRKTDDEYPTFLDFRQSFKQFRKLVNKLYPKKQGAGAFATIEVGSNWNIHIHAIVYGGFYYQDQISREWLRITHDSSVVDIREIRNPAKALNYLLKYISKPPKLDSPEDCAAYLDALIGVRRIHTYGVFYNFRLIRRRSFACVLCGESISYLKITFDCSLPPNSMPFSELRKTDRME